MKTKNDNGNEDQQFLSVGDHKPENANISMNQTNRSNNNYITNNDMDEITQHPVTSFFTLFFKIASIGVYTFGTWFSSNFVFVFVLVILTLACDFWVVKNVSGRLLVGLRWWNDVMEDGNTQWKFESSMKDSRNNKEWRIFWYSLVTTPLLWGLFSLSSLVRLDFKWLPLTIVALALNGAQLWGYWKCSREAQKVVKEWQTGVTQMGSDFMQAQIQTQIQNQIKKSFSSNGP